MKYWVFRLKCQNDSMWYVYYRKSYWLVLIFSKLWILNDGFEFMCEFKFKRFIQTFINLVFGTNVIKKKFNIDVLIKNQAIKNVSKYSQMTYSGLYCLQWLKEFQHENIDIDQFKLLKMKCVSLYTKGYFHYWFLWFPSYFQNFLLR